MKKEFPEIYNILRFFGFTDSFSLLAEFWGITKHTPLFALGTFITEKNGVKFFLIFSVEKCFCQRFEILWEECRRYG